MKAEIKPRIELEHRAKLEEVIPLSEPFVVFVDPSSVCNLECKFCPTGNRGLIRSIGRGSGLMDFEMYKKVIADLCEFDNPVKCLRLYKDGEPLLNPRLADMIAYAKEHRCALQIDTTTNGSLLSPRLNLDLVRSGLDRINISVNGVSEQMYAEFTGHGLQFERFVDNIRHLYNHRGDCVVCIKTVGDIMSVEDEERFYDIFGDIADRVFIEHVAPCWPNFDMGDVEPNSRVGIYGQEIGQVDVCPYIFYSTSVNSDGTVSLCFLDWSRELILGELAQRSLREIWDGDDLFHQRKMQLSGRRKDNHVCANCGQLSHGLPDNIDAHANTLLKRIEDLRRDGSS
jgi:MoaA/NifB/PqqE/SkfB family radical SAM enzyme